MPNSSQPAGKSRKAHGPAPAWLRLASVCVLLIAVPIGLYLFLYQRSRIEDATIRNFRALDTAAGRVDQVLLRLSNVVSGSSFDVSPAMLDEVTDRLTDNAPACGGERGFGYRGWHRPAFPYHLLPSRRTTPAERLEYRYWLAARTLFESNQRDKRATEGLWNHLHCLIDTHRRFSRPDATVTAEVRPLPRTALRPLDPACVHSGDPGCRRLRDLLEAEPCGTSSPRLNAGVAGMEATVADCRRLEERHEELHKALKSFRGSEGVIGAIDLFGTRSAADLNELMEEATGYLSRFFDSHLIADADGLILFETEAASLSATEVDESQVETPGFSSFVNIAELLRVGSPQSDGPGAADAGDGGNGRAAVSAPSFRGRSFERIVSDQDIAVRVFVHPFILDGVAVSGGARGDARAGPASPGAAARPTFYLVGVVDDREFRSAAIRLRLGRVTTATLALLGLLTLTPLLWFWTAGDRVVVGRLALLVVGGLPVVGVVLFTVLGCALVTNRLDEHALDGAMKHVSGRIAELFDRELSDEIHRLDAAVPRLLARAGREAAPRRPGSRTPLPKTTSPDDRTLTRLERALYCDDADRNLDHDPGRPEAWSAFLLSAEGRQRVCLSELRRARPARNPPLELSFRDYFTHPKEGVLWRSPPPTQPWPVGCRIGDAQDEESLIPCLVDRLPEPSKRRFSLFGAPPSGTEAAYFLERIDAVVGGRVTTMLALNTGRAATPVAAAGVSLNALDRAVPPHHVHFAVVDRETGRTLFHSDRELAMTTNFVEDAGRDSALRSLLRSGTRDTIDLVYTGVPVRAHVRPLRAGLPWTLVVYRGHELADRVAALTAALSIFFTLACLVLVAAAAGIVLLVTYWWSPEAPAGVPVTLGRVMAAGSRLAWPCAAGVLVLLLYSPWIARHAWTLAGASPVLPFFAVCSVLAVAAIVVWCSVAERAATTPDAEPATTPDAEPATPPDAGPATTTGDRSGNRTLGRSFGLAALFAALAVAPTALWFGHHRAALGVGLNHYLMDQTLALVDRAREDYRLEALRRHGAGAAPAGDRARRRWPEEQEPEEGWLLRTLRPIVASSELANQLIVYRALPPAAADDVLSIRDVFSGTFGYDVGRPLWPPSEPESGGFLILVVSCLIGLALPIAAMAYSVCAACTLAGRRRRLSLTKLPDAKEHLLPPVDRPLRAIVVGRGERCRDDFVRELMKANPHLSLHALRVQRSARGCLGYVVRWVPAAGSQKEQLYVFDDLKEVLEDDGKARARFDELEKLVECNEKARSHVLIWSRVVPDYRYSDRFGRADRWFARGRSDDADRRDRWSDLARDFRVFVLDGPTAPDECTEGLVRDAREDAVTRLRKGAATCFNQLWTESTHDERLQLYALARGGVANARRTAALSSLVNRGIVHEDPETGVLALRSQAFREFVEHDVDHRELNAWRRERSGVWRLIWPPVAIGGALGLAFLAMANPEMRGTLLATLTALLPFALPFLSGERGAGPTAPPSSA